MMRRAFLAVGGGLSSLALAACAPQSDDKDGAPDVLPLPELASVAEPSESVQYGRDTGARASQAARIIDIGVDELAAIVARGDIRLIDVRRDEEVADGVIPGAEHIAMASFDPAVVSEGDDRPIILYCRSGRRSGLVAERLAAHTGEPATHLEGGILAWQAQDNELVMLPAD
ncbi:hypothetical protein AUC45_11585 [Erythrobacter sp. YT30]|nr:hypothetical protein AUC45_11585 [Erythrobacter sp. YT30]